MGPVNDYHYQSNITVSFQPILTRLPSPPKYKCNSRKSGCFLSTSVITPRPVGIRFLFSTLTYKTSTEITFVIQMDTTADALGSVMLKDWGQLRLGCGDLTFAHPKR